MIGVIALIAYAATIPLANWLIGHAGTICVPDGPCLVPVGFGLMAPSGVLMVGAALVLRDLVQRSLGWQWGIGAIVLGAALSWVVADPHIVIASVAGFALSETADFLVYTPMARRRLWLAVLASSAIGAVVDSAVFLWLAFGSLDLIAGQVVGKLWMSLTAAVLIWLTQRRSRATPSGQQP